MKQQRYRTGQVAGRSSVVVLKTGSNMNLEPTELSYVIGSQSVWLSDCLAF